MKAFKSWCRQHQLGLYIGAVLLPMLLSLGWQYRSLSTLEGFSVAAHRWTLNTYLQAVADEVDTFYRTQAERALKLVEPQAPEREPAPLQPTFRQAQGVQLFFIALMPEGSAASLYFYRPNGEQLGASPAEATVHAVRVALAPWQYLSSQQTAVTASALSVNEDDPAHRIILKPLLKSIHDASQIAGVIGMIVAPDFLQAYYLPKIMQDLLPTFCTEPAQQNAIVAAHDAQGHLLLSSHALPDTPPEAAIPLSFVFTDWRLGVWNRYVTPGQWARFHFAINVGLSIGLALALIAGMILALRLAARSMRLAHMQRDFVANVSHELRTPLAAMRASGELLRTGRVQESEKVREYGGYIEAESLRLTRLINNILDFAKMEAQDKMYDAMPVDIETLVTEVLRTLAVRLEQGGYTLDVIGPPEPLPPAQGDPDAMAQALLNVLDNAMKYAGETRRIRIQLDYADGYNTIAVTDHGIGIPRQEHTRIFERFYRVSRGAIHNVKGSGLGLAIVHHIVTAHRGRISLDSTPGSGTTLTLHFPAADAPSEFDAAGQIDQNVHS